MRCAEKNCTMDDLRGSVPSRLQPPRTNGGVVKRRITALGAAIIVTLVVQAVSPAAGFVTGAVGSAVENVPAILAASYISGTLALVAPAVAYVAYRVRSTDEHESVAEYLRVRRPDVGREWGLTLLYGLLITLIVYLVLNLVVQVFELPVAENHAVTTASMDPSLIPLLMLFSLLLVAPAEELVYRGVIQRRLEEAFHPYVAIGIAALIFGAVHVTAVQGTFLGHAVYVTLIGGVSVVWGYYYHKTEDLVVPALLHGLYNSIIFVIMATQYLG